MGILLAKTVLLHQDAAKHLFQRLLLESSFKLKLRLKLSRVGDHVLLLRMGLVARAGCCVCERLRMMNIILEAVLWS